MSQSCNSSSVSTDDRTAEGISTVSVFMVTVYHGFRLNVSVLSGMAFLNTLRRITSVLEVDLEKSSPKPVKPQPKKRSGDSAERRHLKKTDKFAAVCRRAATKQENRPPSH